MADLFDVNYQQDIAKEAPLAERMRPRSLEELVGQEHLVGKGRALRRALDRDELFSLILWGPPGCGKTTLARLVAATSKAAFVQLSAVASGVSDLKTIVAEAVERRKFKHQRTVLFLDEVHRWNKAQQDTLLPYVERGDIVFIGATTENPSFEVISPLLSRSRVYVLEPLSEGVLETLIQRALNDEERGLGSLRLAMNADASKALARHTNGDARIALSALEVAATLASAGRITMAMVEEALQKPMLAYDKAGEEHYNVISAFIKSIRGSDPDAGLYWLARMLEAGEDPLFIARRLVILASEDIGNADPQALVIAAATFQAVQQIGLPEAQLILAQAVTYLATAPKSNASYAALLKAKEDVQKTLNLPVPLHLRNAVTKLMEDLGYHKGYKYSHDYDADEGKQQYRPKEVEGHTYYIPPTNHAQP